MRRLLVSAMAASLLLAVVAGPATARPASVTAGNAPTIASTAVAADDFNALVLAVGCFDDLLAAVTNPRSNLTVFAPTDAAFADALGFDDADDLLATVSAIPADEVCGAVAGLVGGPDALRGILADHIVPGRFVEGRVLNSTTLNSLGGPVSVADDIAPVLVATNIQTSNGVIHVIDEVLLLDN
jgi:transforming growth factor-beta-induced protein